MESQIWLFTHFEAEAQVHISPHTFWKIPQQSWPVRKPPSFTEREIALAAAGGELKLQDVELCALLIPLYPLVRSLTSVIDLNPASRGLFWSEFYEGLH